MEEKDLNNEKPSAGVQAETFVTIDEQAGEQTDMPPTPDRKPTEKLTAKEDRQRKTLSPKQIQQRKKMLVYPVFVLAFLGAMWLIFAPSGEENTADNSVGAFNANVPLPENDGIIGDKQTAYEQDQFEKRQADKVRSLQDFAISEDNGTGESVATDLPGDGNPGQEPFRDYSGSSSQSGVRSSVAAYQDINRQLGSFYEPPKEDAEKEELKKQVEELNARLEELQQPPNGLNEQVALMEKSYELAAKYMGQNGQNGQPAPQEVMAQIPIAGQSNSGQNTGKTTVPVQAARQQTVSGLQQPMSNAEFVQAYSQPRNYGFNTAVGNGYAVGKNTIRACVHQDQTIMDGQTVKLRLLEPLQAGNLVIPQNTIVSGSGKVQGERLDIEVSSIEYRGNLLPVELAVYDSDGQKGLSIPSSLEQEAAKEAMANIGAGLGTSISFSQSAGQQVAMDLTRGVLQGGSQYLAKKFRTVKVHLKAGYDLMLYAKE